MAEMKIVRLGDRNYDRVVARLDRHLEAEAEVGAAVRDILEEVRRDGDAALLRLTQKFGGPALSRDQLWVAPSELAQARQEVSPAMAKAIRAARRNVLAFARRGLRKTWFRKNAEGAIVGERFDPFQRVGIYIPGGTAPLVSTAVMTCTLAQAAGVPEIVAATPARADGSVAPEVLWALSECGASEILRVGGAQAMAAMAYGTETVRPVQKIFGPGNAYVVEAKRQLFGRVAVDLLPGPSEILVIADRTARPEWVAADILAQCEHGHGSLGILLALDGALCERVAEELDKQARLSGRPRELREAMKNIVLLEVAGREEAVRLANAFAPEHAAIATRDPGEIAARLATSGAIFLGHATPVAAGDFLAGPSHELPTGGAGKSFAGLTADQFQRRTSVVMYEPAALERAWPVIEAFCEAEGLDAHARSVAVRLPQHHLRRKRP